MMSRLLPSRSRREVTLSLIVRRRMMSSRLEGTAAIGAPAFDAGADAETRIGKGNAFVDFVLVGVARRTGFRLADVPELLDEFVAGLVGGQPDKFVAFLFGDDVGDVALEPVAK